MSHRTIPSSLHLEDDFQFDRRAERKACDAVHQSAGVLVFPKNVLQQLRSAICDFRMVAEISGSRDHYTEPDDSRHFVERSQVLPRDCEGVERRKVSRVMSCFQIELSADAPDEFRSATFCGKHSGEEKQIARLHHFRIGAERLRWRRKLDAKFFQPMLGAVRPMASTSYHLPECAPPSTCSTSPVT